MTSALLLLKTMGALVLVLGLFVALVYALKRWGKMPGSPVVKTMEVLGRQSFGPRHHLIIVKISGERNVLVGISPQNMSLLCLSEPAARAGNHPPHADECL